MINNSAVLARYWINDLINAGISYSRISSRLNLSPSTIQKIAKKLRTPRAKTLIGLAKFYLVIFSSPQLYGRSIASYYSENESKIKATLGLTEELLKNKTHYPTSNH